MDRPLIWIVDCDQWPRAALRAELIERGYEAVGHVLLGDALKGLRACGPQARPDALILELRGQEVSQYALRELADSSIPVIILGGTVELNEPSLRQFQWAAVGRRPITLGEIADSIENIVPVKKPGEPDC